MTEANLEKSEQVAERLLTYAGPLPLIPTDLAVVRAILRLAYTEGTSDGSAEAFEEVQKLLRKHS